MTQDQKTSPAWLRWLPFKRNLHDLKRTAGPKLPAIKQVVAQTGRTPAEK